MSEGKGRQSSVVGGISSPYIKYRVLLRECYMGVSLVQFPHCSMSQLCNHYGLTCLRAIGREGAFHLRERNYQVVIASLLRLPVIELLCLSLCAGGDLARWATRSGDMRWALGFTTNEPRDAVGRGSATCSK